MSSTPTTPLRINLDVNGKPTYGIFFSVAQQNTDLTPNAEQHFTVPAAVDTIVFAYTPGSSVWVSNSVTATLPTGSFSDTGCQLNPVMRIVKPGEIISVISNTADSVNANFYLTNALPGGVPQP